jgi:hypothetical protein
LGGGESSSRIPFFGEPIQKMETGATPVLRGFVSGHRFTSKND